MHARIYGIVTALGFVFLASTAGARDSVYFFHNDHLGTPQAMTDLAGRKVWQAEYEPFGKASVNEDPDGDGQVVINNLRFPGQYFDAETGLHYNYHRDYDPATGRYLQPDPIGLNGGMNLYSYVANDPINWTDPLGLDPRDPNTGQTNDVLRCHVNPHNDQMENLIGGAIIGGALTGVLIGDAIATIASPIIRGSETIETNHPHGPWLEGHRHWLEKHTNPFDPTKTRIIRKTGPPPWNW